MARLSKAGILVMACLLFFPGSLKADNEAGLAQIQQELKGLKEGQEKILTKLDQLSEEHKQLRFWVHRK